MKLKTGTTLRQYKILKAIGAGGMGEVYRAHDTNLERDVAVKVLPASFADNANSLARLEREAKAIAALSHPNILAVYDFGTEENITFLVIELLEGETLRERLDKSSIPPRKATDIGGQIARGLAAAHDKGIVHRDLKPENIFLTGDGQVKILDFGLATASTGDDEVENLNLATMTNITVPGTVMGTVNYMSPEHVRGDSTDNRSDLFSFGSVLYEMVGGARPFQRETAAETMTAILREDPAELSTLVEDIPPAVIAIIRRCLEKEPGERFHSAHDLAFSLGALSGSAVTTGTAAALSNLSGPRRRPKLGTIAALLLLGIFLGAAAMWLFQPNEPPAEPVRYTGLSSRRGFVTNGRFTGSDGAAVYSARWDGEPSQVFPVSQANQTSAPLPLGAAHLFSLSSKGEFAVSLDQRNTLGFESLGTLAIAQSNGIAPRAILEDVMAADWAPDGTSLAVAHEVDGIVRLEYPIGTVLYQSKGWILNLRVSPDGEKVAFTDCPVRGDNSGRIAVVDRSGRLERLELPGSWGVVWSADSESVYGSGGGRLLRQGPDQPAEVVAEFPSHIALWDIDSSGRLLISSGELRRESFVQKTNFQELNFSWRDWTTPRHLSADGTRVVFEEGNVLNDDGYAIYVRNVDGTAPVLLGYGATMAVAPDFDRVAIYKRTGQDDGEILLVPIGIGETISVPTGNLRLSFDDGNWFKESGPDGEEGLLLSGSLGDESYRLYFLPIDGGEAHPVTPVGLTLEHSGHLVSDDGRRIIVNVLDSAPVEFDVAGDGPKPLPGLENSDLPLRFDAEGKHVYVQVMHTLPAQIFKVNLQTGERVFWREISPRDPAGVTAIDRMQISADGQTQVYSNRRNLSQLILVEGLK